MMMMMMTASSEAHLPGFWEGCPRDPRAWTAALLALSGDIETNPGPPTTRKATPNRNTNPEPNL